MIGSKMRNLHYRSALSISLSMYIYIKQYLIISKRREERRNHILFYCRFKKQTHYCTISVGAEAGELLKIPISSLCSANKLRWLVKWLIFFFSSWVCLLLMMVSFYACWHIPRDRKATLDIHFSGIRDGWKCQFS